MYYNNGDNCIGWLAIFCSGGILSAHLSLGTSRQSPKWALLRCNLAGYIIMKTLHSFISSMVTDISFTADCIALKLAYSQYRLKFLHRCTTNSWWRKIPGRRHEMPVWVTASPLFLHGNISIIPRAVRELQWIAGSVSEDRKGRVYFTKPAKSCSLQLQAPSLTLAAESSKSSYIRIIIKMTSRTGSSPAHPTQHDLQRTNHAESPCSVGWQDHTLSFFKTTMQPKPVYWVFVCLKKDKVLGK